MRIRVSIGSLALLLLLVGCNQGTAVGEATTKPVVEPHPVGREMVGIWQVDTPEEEAEFITLGPEGAAIHSTRGQPDSNGNWEQQENEQIIIYWENGWVDILTVQNGTVMRTRYEPAADRSGPPTNRAQLKRLSGRKPTGATSWGAGVILEQCGELAGDLQK